MSKLEEYARDIEKARDDVAKAMEAYSRGGSLDMLNKKERELGDAHVRFRECSGGRPHDRR